MIDKDFLITFDKHLCMQRASHKPIILSEDNNTYYPGFRYNCNHCDQRVELKTPRDYLRIAKATCPTCGKDEIFSFINLWVN